MKARLPKIFLTLLFLLTAVSLLVRVYVASNVSVEGDEIKSLEEELNVLKRESTELEKKIYDQSSLIFLMEKATAMGMAKPLGREFLTPVPTAFVEPEKF